MSKAQGTRTSRRQFLAGVGGVAGASGVAASSPLPVPDLSAGAAVQSATVVLHDPRIVLPADVAARLTANGARLVPLTEDPVRMWRTEIGALLEHPDTRLFGITRWSDYLIVRGLAAESRRHTRYEQQHVESGHFTWLIA